MRAQGGHLGHTLMAEPNYRAFISYSHEDEHWAAWLQKSLESFRVPRRLVSRKAGAQVPRKLAPVFRDREDLSTAHNLSERIIDALERSEALIVICSPAAARSPWVNEEIRYFRRLGREEQIFCLVVDGDPALPAGDGGCFPPALIASDKAGSAEPLAADLREHADGKKLARLKLIAGLLGVGLDQLRRREFRRKIRWATVLSLFAAGVLALGFLTMIARVSERQEREYAEQLAGFIVDLGEQLQSEVDLETLAKIGVQAAQHLRRLEPQKLSPATQLRVGKVQRQLGRVAQLQGREQDAQSYFSASHELLSRLATNQPEDPAVLFELAQTEYRIGLVYASKGNLEAALGPWQSYLEIARRMTEAMPDDVTWIMELSYAQGNLAALKLRLGSGLSDEISDRFAEAIRLNERAMQLAPGASKLSSDYANLLAWAADSQLRLCELEGVLSSRQKILELAENAAAADPSDNDLQRRLAYAQTGVALVLSNVGKVAAARKQLLEARANLAALATADPSNVVYRNQMLFRDYLLAWLDSESGRLVAAQNALAAIHPRMKAALETEGSLGLRPEDYIEFLLSRAEIAYRSGEREQAAELLEEGVRMLTSPAQLEHQGRKHRINMLKARFLWWLINGQDGALREYPQLKVPVGFDREFLSCAEADIAARTETMLGNHKAAAGHVAYLRSRGYAEPGFVRFCTSHGLCNH